MTECPSCGRFVGPLDTCPHCGATVHRRLSLRMAKIAAVVLALGGLLALWVAATHAEPPTLPIADIKSTMNWAYVRVQGAVTRYPSYDPETGSLKFWVWDGSGDLMVTAYRTEAQALLDAGLVPAVGDQVAVEGTLRVKEDFAYLTINAPQRVTFQRPQHAEVSIGQIGLDRLYEKVMVRGMVRAVREPYAGLMILEVRDATGAVDVTIPADLVHLTGSPPEVRPGDCVQVWGAVSLYEESPQVTLDDAKSLLLLDETIPIAPERAIGEITAEDAGQMAGIGGRIVEVRPFSAGVKYTIEDDSGQITLLLWQDVDRAVVGREALIVGSEITAQGLVSEYQGELEFVPELALDVQIVHAREITYTPVDIGTINPEDVGALIRIQGQITQVTPFSAGVKYTVRDETGEITLLLWEDVAEAVPKGEDLIAGAEISARGKVSEYHGELEVIPAASADVTVLAVHTATPTPTPEPTATPQPTAVPTPTSTPTPSVKVTAIGDVGSDDVGQRLTVEGKITQVESFSQGVKFTLDDGTGQITLLLWQDTYQALPNRADLRAGTRVRASGVVSEYEGALELVPEAVSDVVILAVAEAPQVTVTAIGQITVADVGQQRTVEGTVVATASFSAGMKFTLDDGTGQIILLLWSNVYETVPDRDRLGDGARVRASGEIDEYRGEMEIIPALGIDVVVLP
jgi:DNA/RNA endonuclease YhcR with UshA esterase domain